MKLRYLKFSFAAIAAIGLFAACEAEIDREGPAYDEVRGDADFSVYVALGNSLTSGYADGALNRHGQLNSYPAILADKMASVTPDFEFDQPLLPVGIANGTLEFKGVGPTGLPNIIPASGGLTNEQVFAKISDNFNNLGVPGAKAGDLVFPGYGSAQGNPYFARFASTDNATVVEDAVAQNPTFFTLWIGNNDVLGYATNGGTGTITPVGEFEDAFTTIVDQLVGSNSNIEGAIANIPSIGRIPFFNTVPWNAFEITADDATKATAGYSAMLDPRIRASVDSVAKTRIIRGVIEEGTRQRIEAEARTPVAQGVATQIIYNQAYEQAYAAAIDAGATEAEAEAIATQEAESYVASDQGQQNIAGLQSQLLNGEAPDAAQAAFEAELDNQIEIAFNSEPVQEQMDTAYNAAINNMNSLETVIEAEGAAAVDSIFNTPAVIAQREAGFQQTITDFKTAGFYPTFNAGPNGFVVYSEQSPTTIKQLTANEKMVLTFLTQQEYNPASGQPVPDKYALDQFELAEVNAAITAYNDVISNSAAENTFALVDMNSFFDMVAGGFTDEGLQFSAAFVTGNAFSLDGVHLTQRGYALVAKKFIQDINSYYNSELPLPKLANYPTLGLPASVE